MGTRTISNNNIYNVQAAGNLIYGILISNKATMINGNKIYDIRSTSVTNPVVTGITMATQAGTTSIIYNNLIGDNKAPNASTNVATNPAVRGISVVNVATATSYTMAHNTVLLNTTSAGANFGSGALFVTGSTSNTAAALTLQNNIFTNLSTPKETGYAAAYQRSSVNYANFSTSSNNNLYYAGTPSSTNPIFYDGTNVDQTLSAYKIRMISRDQAAVSENPNFVSTAGTNATFLHINPAISSQIESGGLVVAAVITDFDGDTRNATTPDIGADEFMGSSADVIGPSITYTLIQNSTCISNPITLAANITDVAGVNTTTAKPRLYYRKSTDVNTIAAGNTSADNGWKYVETSSTSSPFSFTIDASLLQTAFAANDSIYYFVAAQDNAPTNNVSIKNGLLAANPTSVALTATETPITDTARGFKFNETIATTVTIGATGTYPSLTGTGGLFQDINNKGLSGNTTVTIIDAAVTETGEFALNQFTAGCTANPTLTITPQNANTVLTRNKASALIKINGADYVTIDGSTSGGNDRNLTITNTNDTASGIWIASLGAGFGSTNNTIKNCIINTNNKINVGATTLQAGIAVSGSTPTVQGADNHNTTIHNNQITNNNFVLYLNGVTTTGVLNNVTVTNNDLATAPGDTLAFVYGLFLGNAQNVTVSGNNISLKTTAAVAPVGITMAPGTTNATVSNNKINKVLVTNTSGNNGGRGIVVGTTSNITISNNFITGIGGTNNTGFGASSSLGIGIGVNNNSSTTSSDASNINVYYNTVLMSGNYVGTSTSTGKVTVALFVGSGATGLDIRNNILVNKIVNPNATAKNYAIYSNAANTAFNTINYNNYDATGSQAVLGFLTTDQTNLAAIQTAFTQNANSSNISPVFVSGTDLHLDPAANNSLSNTGTSIATVTTDIDGDLRNATTPDMGADEFNIATGVNLGIATNGLLSPIVKSCYTNNESVSVRIENFSTSIHDFTTSPATITVNITGAATQTLTATINTGTLAPNAILDVMIPTNANMSAIGTFTFNASVVATGDISALNDNLSPAVNFTTVAPITGTIFSTSQSFCATGGIPTLSTNGTAGTGTYQWKSSTISATGPWTNEGTSPMFSPISAISTTTWYQLDVTCNSTVSSNVVEVGIYNPTVTTAADVSRCGSRPVLLTATLNQANTVNWYDAAVGGNLLATGATYAPTVTANTTYYAQAVQETNKAITARTTNTALGSAVHLDDYNMSFTVTNPFLLKAVDVFAATGSSIIVILYDGTGTSELQTTGTITTTTNAKNKINLNWYIAPGTYRITQILSNSFYREFNLLGISYPIALTTMSNVGQITGFSANLTAPVLITNS